MHLYLAIKRKKSLPYLIDIAENLVEEGAGGLVREGVGGRNQCTLPPHPQGQTQPLRHHYGD